MQLTPEQEAIIRASGNIKINAVAGSGKTTTIIEYAKAQPAKSKILYLAFNKAVKLEAIRKFADKGLNNVCVETAHSLAYKAIVFNNNYKVIAQGYKTHQIADILGLTGNGEKHTEYIIANHINKFVAYFCNSDKTKVQDLNYLDIVTDAKAKTFVKTFYPYIEQQARILLSKMNNGEIEITHDFYLKKFQLSSPILHYNYILFDEGQDASPAMLDIFLKQPCTKVIVGDTHQQIYAWRNAINSLERVDFPTLSLSVSFRFPQTIADLAIRKLDMKSEISDYKPITISGKGNATTIKTKAVIARTNLGLLLKAIEYVTEKKEITKIYFEGNINSYTYADEGASLYDVLNLYNNKREMIRDVMITSMQSMKDLEEYIDKTEDSQLGMMVEIVKEYGNRIPGIIKSIKDKHLGDDQKEKAELVFSTVHRCKGMEYDAVHLADDFLTEEKLEKAVKDKKKPEINKAKLNEEINLLYVAITRARYKIYIPPSLLPEGFPLSQHIQLLKEEPKKEFTTRYIPYDYATKTNTNNLPAQYAGRKLKSLGVRPASANKPWTPEQDAELTTMFCDGYDETEMVRHFDRSATAISLRIKKLQLVEKFG